MCQQQYNRPTQHFFLEILKMPKWISIQSGTGCLLLAFDLSFYRRNRENQFVFLILFIIGLRVTSVFLFFAHTAHTHTQPLNQCCVLLYLLRWLQPLSGPVHTQYECSACLCVCVRVRKSLFYDTCRTQPSSNVGEKVLFRFILSVVRCNNMRKHFHFGWFHYNTYFYYLSFSFFWCELIVRQLLCPAKNHRWLSTVPSSVIICFSLCNSCWPNNNLIVKSVKIDEI